MALLGGAAAWPLAARAQQQAMPLIGLLDSRSPEAVAERLRGYRQGLKETGYVENENVAILYRFAENQPDRLPGLAADLVRRQVSMIATAGENVAVAVKGVTAKIPIIFIVTQDPVKLGLVASLARPGGNVTGVNFFASELVGKRLEILRELAPGTRRVAVLINPTNPSSAETTSREVAVAARGMGVQVQILNISTIAEIDAAFATFARDRPDALFVASDPFFTSRRVHVVSLATRHGIPTAFANREAAEAGGLMSYGASITDAWRQAGAQAGRILKGAVPADLPVVQSTKFEFVINRQIARMLGLEVPATLLASADEVIE
jgi:putative ABC transport system substrate-binding protein